MIDSELQLKEPLSITTRKCRRSLLASSVLGIIVGHTGLLPEKISDLGIRFSNRDQSALLVILSLLILYFLVTFFLYAAHDFTLWRLANRLVSNQAKKEKSNKPIVITEDKDVIRGFDNAIIDQELPKRINDPIWVWSQVNGAIRNIRGFLDFFLPVIIAFYSIGALIGYIL